LSCCAEEIEDVVVVSLSCRDGAENTNAIFDKEKTGSKSKAPLDVALDECMGIFSTFQGFRTLNDLSCVRC